VLHPYNGITFTNRLKNRFTFVIAFVTHFTFLSHLPFAVQMVLHFLLNLRILLHFSQLCHFLPIVLRFFINRITFFSIMLLFANRIAPFYQSHYIFSIITLLPIVLRFFINHITFFINYTTFYQSCCTFLSIMVHFSQSYYFCQSFCAF